MAAQELRSGERPTVLHVSQPVDGGVARVVADLVRAQVAAGLRTVVAAPPGGTLLHDAAAVGAETAPWPARRAPGPALPGETGRLARLIRRLGPDLVHAHSAKAGLAARLAVRGRIPTVHQPHAWSFEAVGGTAGRLAVGWERYAARWTHRVLCVSEAERQRGAAAGVPGRWTVVRNGVDLHRCSPAYDDAAARHALRRSLPALAGLAPKAPLVVCVGRLCPQKDQRTLLRAWPAVRTAVPDAVLVLVGDGPDHARLRTGAPPGVRFAGAAPDAVPWYRVADLAVLPSRWEAMALTPLEAMACGRPVVVTDVGGAREALPPGAAPHCLVPPGDPAALAQALRGLLTRPQLRTELGRRALAHTRATGDVRRTAAAVVALYRELLGAAGPERGERSGR
ncbi:glycosyltransferase family 4 protein [Streptomyces sp. NRRL S-337]|uniref:glycosyltransferase family 4 protein n=1 Tax=Streptomyces sp. NRRL S-337 TaxID=1463900 RepID=UPI000A47113C|nr:glycosyltransferase family 4 protein [Streptomyces sp. NRRL S-337]